MLMIWHSFAQLFLFIYPSPYWRGYDFNNTLNFYILLPVGFYQRDPLGERSMAWVCLKTSPSLRLLKVYFHIYVIF